MSRSIAAPVVITVVGLVLALAVADNFEGVDLTMIGWILAVAGVVWGVYTALAGRRETTTRVVERPVEVVEEAPPTRRVVRNETAETDEL